MNVHYLKKKKNINKEHTSLRVISVFLSILVSLTSSLFSFSSSLTLVQESLKKIISLPMVRFSFSREEILWLQSSNLESRISACCLSRLFSFSRSFLSFSSWELSCSRFLFWGRTACNEAQMGKTASDGITYGLNGLYMDVWLKWARFKSKAKKPQNNLG